MRDLTSAAGAAWGALEPRSVPAAVETAAAPQAAEDARFNPFHAPAGPGGGEFTSGGSGGGKTAAKPDAHQQHEAHLAHLQHLAAEVLKSAKTGKALTPQQAQEKTHLLGEAKADRAKARQLQQQLDSVNKQIKASQEAAAKAHAAAVKAGKPNSTHRATAMAKKHRTVHKHVQRKRTLQHQASDLQGQIHTLLTQAAALEHQAAAI